MVTTRAVGSLRALETGWAERPQAKSAVETGKRGYDADKTSIERPMRIVELFLQPILRSTKYIIQKGRVSPTSHKTLIPQLKD